jgi:hypothetical protein
LGDWQQREQYVALERQARDSTFLVIPVLLPQADPGLGFLGQNTWVDLREQRPDDPAQFALLVAAIRGAPRYSLLGALDAAQANLIVPILIGPEAKIRAAAEAADVDLGPYRLMTVSPSEQHSRKIPRT